MKGIDTKSASWNSTEKCIRFNYKLKYLNHNRTHSRRVCISHKQEHSWMGSWRYPHFGTIDYEVVSILHGSCFHGKSIRTRFDFWETETSCLRKKMTAYFDLSTYCISKEEIFPRHKTFYSLIVSHTNTPISKSKLLFFCIATDMARANMPNKAISDEKK